MTDRSKGSVDRGPKDTPLTAARSRAIELGPEEFRRLGKELVDRLADIQAGIRERPVTVHGTPAQLGALLPAPALPERGTDPEALLAALPDLLFDHSLLNGHPQFYGYVTSSATPTGALAELLAASVNANVGGWQLSPIASEIEKQTVDWLRQMLGMPNGSSGVFVSGGNMANMVGFMAGVRAKMPESIRKKGLASLQKKWLVYASPETHTWIQKAADLFGHGTDCVRAIPVDDELRADPVALASMLREDREQGHRPFLLIATAGTVSTGAVDPLDEMATLAKEHDLWFHVDGAYGGFAAMLPEQRDRFRGLERADSVAVDPHKWLYAPIEAGCTIVRDPAILPGTFAYRPPYYHFDEEEAETNFFEYSLQNTRGFRALKVWLGIRQAGRAGYEELLRGDIALARELYDRMQGRPDFEAFTHGLSIATFRYVPEHLDLAGSEREKYLNELNEALLEAVKKAGELFVSNAVLGGAFVLRACIVNFRTTTDDVRAVPDLIAKHGKKLHESRTEWRKRGE
ncbi:MAG: aminotransferase class V-fold PLP-dependent enzyme [Gemmatimonadetes bacterium]|nr:aminotransferase class V-fold PLP-dependent enzyme [Gemmatimonadota bacterium]